MIIGKVQVRQVSRKLDNPIQKQGATKRAEAGNRTSFDSAGKTAEPAVTRAVQAPQTNEHPTDSGGSRSEETLRNSLVQDVRESFKELGIFPPPSRFGGIRLALSTDSPASTNAAAEPESVMRLRMVKAVTKRMSERLRDTETL